jgi:hypothetical protein
VQIAVRSTEHRAAIRQSSAGSTGARIGGEPCERLCRTAGTTQPCPPR